MKTVFLDGIKILLFFRKQIPMTLLSYEYFILLKLASSFWLPGSRDIQGHIYSSKNK